MGLTAASAQDVSQPTQPNWRAVPKTEYRWAEWDENFVLFHRPSGKTHFLNSASVLLLESVLQLPKTLSQATSELAAMRAVVAGPEYEELVGATLARLDQLGLVERVAA